MRPIPGVVVPKNSNRHFEAVTILSDRESTQRSSGDIPGRSSSDRWNPLLLNQCPKHHTAFWFCRHWSLTRRRQRLQVSGQARFLIDVQFKND